MKPVRGNQSAKGNNCPQPYSLWHEKNIIPQHRCQHFSTPPFGFLQYVHGNALQRKLPPSRNLCFMKPIWWRDPFALLNFRIYLRQPPPKTQNYKSVAMPFHQTDFGPEEKTLALYLSGNGRAGLLTNFHLLQKTGARLIYCQQKRRFTKNSRVFHLEY